MSLYAEAQAIEVGERKSGATQSVRSTLVDITRLEELAGLIEEALPNAVLNRNAIEKNGPAPDGTGKMVPYAVKQTFPVKASVTVYYNGKVSWAGIEPITLPDAVETDADES